MEAREKTPKVGGSSAKPLAGPFDSVKIERNATIDANVLQIPVAEATQNS
jgi:hypothetical protein